MCGYRDMWSILCVVSLYNGLTVGGGSDYPIVTSNSFDLIPRALAPVPEGRILNINDTLVLHYRYKYPQPKTYRLKDINQILSDPYFDPKKPTAIYFHGYLEIVTDESLVTVVRAYLKNGSHNFLLVDWSNFGFGNYLTSIVNVNMVGVATGKALTKLLNAGLSADRLHLVGHSMGAHIGAVASRTLAKSGFKVKRLTGLDPAFPGFYPPLKLHDALSPSDASFVDVIHTNGGWYGADAPTGHADFWPNGGLGKQPGCNSISIPLTVDDFCSHWRSWAFWAESLTGGRFLARKCSSYTLFQQGACNNRTAVPMGIQANSSLRGNFYLRTSSKPPYSLGEQGAS